MRTIRVEKMALSIYSIQYTCLRSSHLPEWSLEQEISSLYPCFVDLFGLPFSGSWFTYPIDPDPKDWVYSVSKVCFCRKKAIEPLDTMFNCPFCNHEKSCEVCLYYSRTLSYMTGEDLSNYKKSASTLHKSITHDGPSYSYQRQITDFRFFTVRWNLGSKT